MGLVCLPPGSVLDCIGALRYAVMQQGCERKKPTTTNETKIYKGRDNEESVFFFMGGGRGGERRVGGKATKLSKVVGSSLFFPVRGGAGVAEPVQGIGSASGSCARLAAGARGAIGGDCRRKRAHGRPGTMAIAIGGARVRRQGGDCRRSAKSNWATGPLRHRRSCASWRGCSPMLPRWS